MAVVRNIITRVGADASPLTEEMKKAQNTILNFRNESMSALKSFGLPNINSTNLVESIKSGQRTIVNFAQESNETMQQFRDRVRTTLEEAGIDVTQYEKVLQNATSVHAEFAKGAVKNFQAVTAAAEEVNNKAEEIRSSFGESFTGVQANFGAFKDAIGEAFKTLGDGSASFGDKIGAVSNAVVDGFGLMTGAVEIFVAIEVVKKVGEWIGELQDLAAETQDVSRRFDSSLGGMSDTAKEFTENLSNSYGILNTTLEDMMSKEYLNNRMMGFNPEQSEKMSESIIQLSYDLGKLRGEDPSQVYDALQRGMEGQTRGLKDLGIAINATDLKNRALSEGLIRQGQTLTTSQTALMTYQEIMQKTAGIQGYYKTTTDDISTQTTKLNAGWTEMKEKLAEDLTPAFTGLLKALNFVASGFETFVEDIGTAIQYISLFAEDAYSTVEDILNLDFGQINKDWGNNYNSIFNSSEAAKKYGEALDASTTAANNQDQAMKNLNNSLNANVMSFDQVHNISNTAAAAMQAQTDAVSNLANAMDNLNSNGMNNISDNKSKGIVIPITFGNVPKFPNLPTPPAVTVSAIDSVSPVLQNIKSEIISFNPTLVTIKAQAIDGVSSVLNSMKVAISSWQMDAINSFNSVQQGAISSFNSIKSSLDRLGASFNNNAAGINNWASNTSANIDTWKRNGISDIEGFATASTTNITNWVNNGETNIKNFTTNTGNNINSWASAEAKDIGDFSVNASENMANWVNATAQNVNLWASNTSSNINAFIAASESNINSWASATSQDFNSWISTTSTNMVSWSNSALSSIVSFAQQSYAAIASLAGAVGATVGSGFNFVENSIGSKISGLVNYVEANPAQIIIPALVTAGAVAAIAAAPFTGGASLAALPALATGGIATKPMPALIGDGGEPEAVIPLSQLGNMLNGTSVNTVSSNGNTSSQHMINVTLKLDGRTLARIIRPYTVNEESRVGTVQGYDTSFNYPK